MVLRFGLPGWSFRLAVLKDLLFDTLARASDHRTKDVHLFNFLLNLFAFLLLLDSDFA